MTTALGPSVVAAIRDAGVVADERGLMALADARQLVAGLSVFEKAPSDQTNILGADTAWAALLSLEGVAEFLTAALRIRWNFHVRGFENLATLERYGDGILPWIEAAPTMASATRRSRSTPRAPRRASRRPPRPWSPDTGTP